MKKLIAACAAVVLVLSFSASAAAKSVFTLGVWTVEKIGSGSELGIVSCSAGDEALTVVSQMGGMPVTAVNEYAFSGNETLVSLSAQAPLKTIGEHAFQNNTRISSVILPQTLDTIGVFAFAGSGQLADINIQDTAVREIPAYCFMNTGLESVVLPETCETVADNAFLKCASLREIVIPDTVTKIGENAFAGCDNLTIVCRQGSYAEQFAVKHQIPYRLIQDEIYILGDVDGNGRVNVKDITVLQRYLAELEVPDVKRIKLCGDMTGDGIKIDDVTWIQKWIADMDTPYAVNSVIEVA